MSRARPGVKVIIVADGEVDLVALRTVACPEDGPAPLVIGADGGALRAEAADVVPDLVIGDGDSVSAEELDRLRDLGAAIRLVAAAKDESDTELCVREALLHKADCACAEVGERKDGEWVKVGGMLTGIRKFRTRAGGQIMRATLDDLEGQVELLVFEKTMIACQDKLHDDAIVIVRGTVDHGDNQLCVKVSDLDLYDPTDTEIVKAREAALKAVEPPPPLKLRLDAGKLPAGVIDDLKQVFADHPGESEVLLDIVTGNGQRRLKLGEGFRVAARNASLKAELDRLLGPTAAPPPASPAPVSAAA